MTFRALRLLGLAILLLAAGMAGSAPGSDRIDADLNPSPRPLESVDKARAAKMAELAAAAERVRGLKLKAKPPWLVKSPNEVYSFMLRAIQSEASPREVELGTRLYALFGFWQPDFDLLGAQLEAVKGAVRAFYNSSAGDFTMVRVPDKMGHGQRMDIDEEAEIVHEYTHALQAHNGLLARLSMSGGNDRSQAARALVEGDAVVTMCVYAIGRAGGSETVDPAMLSRSLTLVRVGMAGMAKSPLFRKHPPIIGASLIFSYTGGSSFAEVAYKKGGWEELNRCYLVPPISTEQIIHPEKYFRAVPEDPVKIELPDIRARLLPGAQIVDVDALGEMEITVLLAGFVPAAEARRSAAGWGGEIYTVFERTAGARKGQVALTWLTVWDTEKDAEEFFASYARALDKKSGVERRTLKADALFDWRGPLAKQEARLERRGVAVLSVEGTDEAETARLAEYFWGLKRSPPPPRQRTAPAAP